MTYLRIALLSTYQVKKKKKKKVGWPALPSVESHVGSYLYANIYCILIRIIVPSWNSCVI